jgi:ubiquinone/menaquinone biosynthesis C-methylase UbiE
MSKKLSYDHEERAKAVEALIPDDINRLLDVGCGPGDITNRLTNYEVTALDINEKYLEEVRCPKKVLGSIDQLPFNENAFELVICTSVLEHLEKDVLKRGIEELKRVSGKYLLISTPYLENLRLGYMECQQCKRMFNAY